ncbi:MAG TPA: regulatory iron-sulfur-containing complex subunit RicT, partial [bacterium]|nr:regulatory iron-sulfur-containing complex subunit RicT [bacterium]
EDPGIVAGAWLVGALERGEELARAASNAELRDANRVPQETRKIVRKATEQDVERAGRMKQRATEAIATCRECIEQQKLPMTLVDADYAFDGSKLTFFFIAETRVDFRKLVRDLAHIFRTRIELRQIGVRDEAKRMGGLGPCGREICCATFLRDFAPVSIKMAKDQGLNLSPVKISGLCGRLMCCLNYEEEYYRTRRHQFPRIGQKAQMDNDMYTVISVNLLTDTLWLEGPERRVVKLALDEFKERAQVMRGGSGGERGGDQDRRGRARPWPGSRRP